MATLSNLTDAVLAAVAATPGLAVVQRLAAPGPAESAQSPSGGLALSSVQTATDGLDRLSLARFELTLTRRDADAAANAAALQSLADAAIASLLEDPTQGGLAVIGSDGAATVILDVEPARAGRVSPPLASIVVRFGCHFLPADGLAALPANQRVRIDGQDLLASGPHALAVSAWQRRRLDRRFAGLDGAVCIDLGATIRPIEVTGRLVGGTQAELIEQIEAIDELNDSADLHEVTGTGQAFGNVRLERIEWGRVLSAGASQPSCVGYRIGLAQVAEE